MLDKTTMAPTYKSPPIDFNCILNAMLTRLSVEFIINGEIPKDKIIQNVGV